MLETSQSTLLLPFPAFSASRLPVSLPVGVLLVIIKEVDFGSMPLIISVHLLPREIEEGLGKLQGRQSFQS